MMTESLDVGNCLLLDRLSELRDVRWVVSTTERKILPDQQSQLIGDIIEDIVLIYASSPHPKKNPSAHTQATIHQCNSPNHDLISVLRQLQPLAIPRLVNRRQERICRDPVTAAYPQRGVVDLKEEAGTLLILQWPLDQPRPSQSE